MSKYTKTVANTPEADRTNVLKKLKTSIHNHTGFAKLDDPSKSLSIDSSKATGYSPNVIALAGQLKYQHEQDFVPAGENSQKFDDSFYLQYAKRLLDTQYNTSFDKVFGGLYDVPDSAYAQYSYEEIITMANNGVNIPTEVLAWAKAQQETDIVDYIVLSDNAEDTDNNGQDNKTGESEINKIRAEVKENAIRSKKAQEDVEKDREKSRELTDSAISIARKQKNILQNNSIDKIKDMADEWKSLDKKKQEEGKLDASEEARYKKLSNNLKQGGAVIDEIQKNSIDLDNFLESIDTLTNDSNEGLTTAQKTIDSSKNFSKLDDRLNIFQKVHAYKIAEKGSGLLEDALVNVNDTQLAYVAEKIGHDLLDIGNEGIQDVTNENTQEAVKFSLDYTTKVKHIENTLGIKNTEDSEKINTQEEEVKESEPEASVEPQEETPVANAPEASVEPQEETPVANAPEKSVEPQEETTVANAPETSVEPQEETPAANAPEKSVEPQEETTVANAPEASVEPQEETPAANAPEKSVEPQEETTVANAPEASVEPQEETPAANAPEKSVEPQEETTVANAPETSVEPQEKTTVANVSEASVEPQEETTVANVPETSVEPQEETTVANAPETSVEPQEETTVANAPETSVEPQEEIPVANAHETSVEPQEKTTVANAPETSVEPQEEIPVANAHETSVEPQEEQDVENSAIPQFSATMTRAASVSPSAETEEPTVANAPEASVEPQEETPVANAPEASVEPQEETTVANAPETSVEPQEETTVANAPETSVEPQEEQDVENSAIPQFSATMTRAASVSPSAETEEPTVANAPETSVEPQEETTVANAPEASVEPQEETTDTKTVQEPSETPTETENIYVSEDDTASNLTNAASSGRSPQDIMNNPVTTRSANTNTNTNNNIESSNKTNSSDKNEKAEQKEKEEIEDTQKTMKALYGTNVDFTKAFVGAEVAAAVGMGPASYIMQIAVWGGIVAASVLDLLAKNLVVGKSSEIAENEVKNSADFVKSLDTSSKAIIAEHTKNMAEAKLISNEYKELNNQSIDYQFAMMQDQTKLVEAGKISADDIIEYPDPFAGDKQNLEAKLQGLSDKDSQKINTINGPLKNSEKISKQSMKSNNDFSGLNDKLGERNSNNNLLGDIIIVDTAIAQGLITITMAALAVMGFFSAPMLAAWAVALAKNAGLAATGVGAKLVSNQVDNRIDANNETFHEGQKSLIHDDKVKNDVRRVTAKAAADKMGNTPTQQEKQTTQNTQQNDNSENTTENENSPNNSSNNVTAPSPSVRKESDTRSGFDKSSLNSELDINNPNDVKKANEYAIAYTRDVNVYDEKSKAAASTNSSTSAPDSNTTADIKLSRFNKDGAINSSKRAQRVNAASATHNGRTRR